MTIATIGRLIKNFDIAGLPLVERSWIDLHALPDLLDAFDNHSLARLQTFPDDPFFADGFAQVHGLDSDGVAVVNHSHLMRTLQINDRQLRNQQRSWLDPNRGADS